MLPVLTIGALSIKTYPFMYSLAILVGGGLALWRLRNFTENPRELWNGVLLSLAALLVGLFLPAVLESRLRSLINGEPPGPVAIRVYYGLGTSLLVAYGYTRFRRLPFWGTIDRTIPAFALGYSIARLGCLAAGCCGGRETDAAWALYLPDEHGIWAMRYPTQILSCAFQFLLFTGLSMGKPPTGLHLPAWLKMEGTISLLYILLFCLERFTLEFLRADLRPIWGPFSLPHILMLIAIVAVLVLFHQRTYQASTIQR